MHAQDVTDLAPIDQDLEKQHQEKTKVKNIQTVEMGCYEVPPLLRPPCIAPLTLPNDCAVLLPS